MDIPYSGRKHRVTLLRSLRCFRFIHAEFTMVAPSYALLAKAASASPARFAAKYHPASYGDTPMKPDSTIGTF